MAFDAPVAEQRFVLEHIARVADLEGTIRFPGLERETVNAILDGAGRLAEGEWAPLLRTGDTDGPRMTSEGVVMPKGFREAYRAYVDGGWGGVGFPAGYGGMGLPFTMSMAVLETLGGANMAFALAPILTGGAVEALLHHGTETQKARYLPRLVSGAWTGTMNLTEPQAGSDVGALTAIATPRDDGNWSIRGTKIFISFGDHDMTDNIVHLVLARTPGAPRGSRGISLFLVPKYRLDAEGEPACLNDVKLVSIEHKMGLHASPTCVLSFGENGDCIGELVGAEHGGLRAMFTMMNNARPGGGAAGGSGCRGGHPARHSLCTWPCAVASRFAAGGWTGPDCRTSRRAPYVDAHAGADRRDPCASLLYGRTGGPVRDR
jgi:alkylation response protein AidB-like acyl-CoA dehydrogenase